MKVIIQCDIFIMELYGFTLTQVNLLKTRVLKMNPENLTVVMYGCESWTMKKASTKELMLLNCGVGEDS